MDRTVVGHHAALTGRAVLLAVPAAFLVLLFAIPVAAVVRVGLAEGAGEMANVMLSGRTWQIVGFTAMQAALSTLATLAIALPVAVVLAMFRFPGRAVLRALVLVPFVMPTVVVAAAFLALVGPRGIIGVDLSGTLWGLVMAHMFLNLAVVIRVVGSALATIDPAFSDAARVLGADRPRVVRTVIWPMIRPAVRSAAMIVFLFCFTSFGVVQVLGAGQLRTVEVEIYRQTTYLLDLPAAAALSLLQLLAVVAMLAVIGRDRGVRTGAAVDVARRPRGAQRIAVAAIGVLAAGLVLAPIAVMVVRSVQVGGDWSLAGWRLLFSPPSSTNAVSPGAAVLASLRTGVAATFIAVLFGTMAALGLAATKARRWAGVDAFLLLPLGTSAVTIGLGMLLAFGRPPLDLRNTGTLIVLAQSLVALPFVVRVLTPAFRGFDRGYLQAAAVLGRSPGSALLTVAVPMLLPALAVAVGFSFAVTIGEFGATVFLATPSDPTLPVAISRLLARPGELTVAAAYAASTLLVLVIVGVVVAVDRVRLSRAVAF